MGRDLEAIVRALAGHSSRHADVVSVQQLIEDASELVEQLDAERTSAEEDQARLHWLHQRLIDHQEEALRVVIGETQHCDDGTPIGTLVFTLDGQIGYESLSEAIDAKRLKELV